MIRLTKRNADGTCYVPSNNMKMVIDKLAKYEDADEENRLFTSKYGVGDWLFSFDNEGDFCGGTITDIVPDFVYLINSDGITHKCKAINDDFGLGL